MSFRRKDIPSEAAAKASFSTATAYRIESDPRPPSQKQTPRTSRRRDPLDGIFDKEVVPLLVECPSLRAVTIFEELRRRDPKLPASVRGTLERRVRRWRVPASTPNAPCWRRFAAASRHTPGIAMVLSLPFSLPDATPIGDRYAMQTRDGITYYFFNLEPFDCHPADDRRAMLLRAAKLQVVSGGRQADIMAAFNISRPTLARAVKRYREHGEDAFFEPRRRRGRTVVDAQMAAKAAELLASGMSGSACARRGRGRGRSAGGHRSPYQRKHRTGGRN